MRYRKQRIPAETAARFFEVAKYYRGANRCGSGEPLQRRLRLGEWVAKYSIVKCMDFKVIFLASLLFATVARAYPPDDPRNYRNTAFIRAHFALNAAIRHLKTDLGFIQSSDAKTALIEDFKALQSYPDIEWWDPPQEEAHRKILQDKKSLEPFLKFKPITRRKFRRDEKALDAAIKGWNDANA